MEAAPNADSCYYCHVPDRANEEVAPVSDFGMPPGPEDQRLVGPEGELPVQVCQLANMQMQS